MRRKRSEIANPLAVNTLHITQRCARQNFLLDDSKRAKGRFKRRRMIIYRRLAFLASVFAVDIFRVAFMSNHLHLTLRNRPDIVSTWSDHEVARRWLTAFPGYCQAHVDFYKSKPTAPSDDDIRALSRDKERIKTLRGRLSDISTFMWGLNNYLSKLFNMIDKKKGSFWDGRYKSQALLDDIALLICGLYIDLNPIRAGIARTPEESLYTSAYWQLESKRILAAFPNTNPASLPDAFLSPIQICEDEHSKTRSATGCRASDLGFLSMSDAEYLILLDLVGRIVREDKIGSIPADLPPIFERLNFSLDAACELVKGYRNLFKSFVGTASSIKAKTSELGSRRLTCPAVTRRII